MQIFRLWPIIDYKYFQIFQHYWKWHHKIAYIPLTMSAIWPSDTEMNEPLFLRIILFNCMDRQSILLFQANFLQ